MKGKANHPTSIVEWMYKIREINPIRPAPQNNPVCYKLLALVYKNNP